MQITIVRLDLTNVHRRFHRRFGHICSLHFRRCSTLCLAIVIVICRFLESSPGTPAEIYPASSFPRYDFIVVAD